LNSTPLGEVINERQLHRHRTRAGFRIGDGNQIDLFRYVGWLVHARHAPQPDEDADPYEALKERARARNAALSQAGRDIGALPAVVDPARKDRASFDFRYFCEAYFPLTFHLAWSPDHLNVIARIEEAVLKGGLFAMAMPRGSGKTTICESACIWAVLYGHREFVCLIGSDEGHATEMLETIKTELDGNDLLLADFPEVIYPIHRLEGIANRASGQLYLGRRTHITWTAKQIVLPTIDGSKASGAIIKVGGITGRIRGMKYKRADGQTVRPSLVVLDDPQTDESARSISQCVTRESILAGAVLGLAGPGRKISGIMPCTVIRPGDMADNILDRDKHPEWNGERTKMVYSFPTNTKLWEKYAELWTEGMQQGQGIAAATEFYRQNRQAMDEGALVAWEARYNEDELSAIQHAMNLKLQDEAAFHAEDQNEPLPEIIAEDEQVTAEVICGKANGRPRGKLPLDCDYVTMFIDVQQKLLLYVICAWKADFTGQVIDYWTWPEQQRAYFTLRDAQRTLAGVMPRAGLEGAIYGGLKALAADKLGREWRREDGAMLRIERCLVDANWGISTDVVYQFCRESAWSAVLLPSHGKYVGASSLPMNEYERRPGQHRLLADHLTAEYRVKTIGRGRTVDEWKQRPERPDNHWFDCLVGCAVGASIQGAALLHMGAARSKTRRHSLAEYAETAQRGDRTLVGICATSHFNGERRCQVCRA
jgi:hypothetical protein